MKLIRRIPPYGGHPVQYVIESENSPEGVADFIEGIAESHCIVLVREQAAVDRIAGEFEFHSIPERLTFVRGMRLASRW